MTTEAQKKAIKKYLSNLAEIRIRLTKEKKAAIKEMAAYEHKSLNQFIIDRILPESITIQSHGIRNLNNGRKSIVTKKNCDTCEFAGQVCMGYGIRTDNGQDTYGMDIDEAKKMFPEGCEDWGISLGAYIEEQDDGISNGAS